MTVMTGGRGSCTLVVVVAVVEQRLEFHLLLLTRIDQQDLRADSSANSSICSSARVIVAVTISPFLSRKRTTSAAVRFNLGANSWAETPRSTTTVPWGTGALDEV
jgi:hypothetical protein